MTYLLDEYEQSSRTTIPVHYGDTYLRKKGNGWMRRITGSYRYDGHLWLMYEEALSDGEFNLKGCCTVYAMLRWGKKI
tara:strand:+ start:603 stop:836 length:234 start_codon:yes stop_codon:yes gene_type:complete